MKRLIRKTAETSLLQEVEIGDTAHLHDDEKYVGLTMNNLSLPENRDGAVLIDTKENVIRWGLNGETHENLLDKYYSDVISDPNQLHYETDEYLASGVYLKDFLGHEAVILYSDDVIGTEDVITKEKPGAYVYVDDWEDGLQRIASKKMKIKRVG